MRTRTRLPVLLALLVLGALASGCGGDDPESGGSGRAGSGSGTLEHVDGVLSATGDDSFSVDPREGEPLSFTYGPEVQRAAVRAIESTGGRARVTWRDTDDGRLAVSVEPAPVVEGDVATYEGMVTEVSSTSISIDGPDGERTFAIPASLSGAFDVDHLQEHADEDSPVRIYFEQSAPDDAIAYEDA